MAVQKIRWGEIGSTHGGSFTLSPGLDPSYATVNIGHLLQSLPKTASLTISDGTNTIIFQDCRAEQGGQQRDATGNGYFVRVRDRRWRWPRKGEISGEYNRRDATGKIIDESTKKNARELATLLLTAMGETGFDVSGLPTTEYPYAFWSVDNPSFKLGELCSRYSVLIWLWTDNKIYLRQKGIGAEPPEWNRESHEMQESLVDKPQTMLLKGGVNLYQVTLRLKPVALETDGTTVDLDSVSYKPAAGWIPGSFANLSTPEAREAAEKSVFKWYKIDTSATGWSGEKYTLGSTQFTLPELLRRWSKELVETAEIEGENKRKAPYIVGKHAAKNLWADPNAVSGTSERVKVSFNFDERLGIVKFSSVVFDYDSSTHSIVGSTLDLTCAFSGEIFRYQKTYKDGVDGLGPEIVARDDVRYEYITGTCNNKTDADARAEAYLAEEALKYKTFTKNGTSRALTEAYAGIKDPGVSGGIEQITWAISNRAVSLTTVSWGQEHNLSEPPRQLREAEVELGKKINKAKAVQKTDKPDDSKVAPPDYWTGPTVTSADLD